MAIESSERKQTPRKRQGLWLALLVYGSAAAVLGGMYLAFKIAQSIASVS